MEQERVFLRRKFTSKKSWGHILYFLLLLWITTAGTCSQDILTYDSKFMLKTMTSGTYSQYSYTTDSQFAPPIIIR